MLEDGDVSGADGNDREMKENCTERIRLALEVAKSVEKLHATQAAKKLAVQGKRDTTTYNLVLAEVRDEGRRALAALNQHKKEHGCG